MSNLHWVIYLQFIAILYIQLHLGLSPHDFWIALEYNNVDENLNLLTHLVMHLCLFIY